MIAFIMVALSWVLLRVEGKGLGALGFNQPKRRAIEWGAGFLITGAVATLQQFAFSLISGVPWRVNPSLTLAAVGAATRANLNSVLYEELLFRGYLLYQAIRFLGPRNGVLLSAAAFGVYHWFTYGLLGNWVAMIYVFILTGSFGVMCALAFRSSKSVALPIGLHLGWNTITYTVFSDGPLGKGIFLPASVVPRGAVPDWARMALSFVLPLAMVAVVSIALIRREKKIKPGTDNPAVGSLPAAT